MSNAAFRRGALLALLSLSACDAGHLRRAGDRQQALVVDGMDPDADFKTKNMTSIVSTANEKCICDEGFFWHWRLKQCIAKGGIGYECGFFPEEHHKFVCAEGLTCKKLEQTETKYFHPGAVPASCRPCAPEDKCQAGGGNSCLKLYTLSGEACVEIEVDVAKTASKEAEQKVTAEASATKTATAEATVGDFTKTEKATADATAAHTATASAEAEAEAHGVATGSACVSIEDVKKELGLKKDGKVGAVLAAQVIFKGDMMAFDKAYAEAVAKAEEQGELTASQEAEKLATKKASEEAKMEAEAKAAEKAAEAAEIGAKAQAQDAAEASAAGAAQQAADAADAAKADAEAAAAAEKANAEAAAAAAKAEAEKKAKMEAAAKAAAEQTFGPPQARKAIEVPKDPEAPSVRKVPGEYHDTQLP